MLDPSLQLQAKLVPLQPIIHLGKRKDGKGTSKWLCNVRLGKDFISPGKAGASFMGGWHLS